MQNRNCILVADDVELNRAIIAAIFEDQYRIVEAKDGVEAIEKANRFKDDIAIVLLDLEMPHKTGYDVLKTFQENGFLEQFPVIVISSETSSKKQVTAFDLGAHDLIGKPFDVEIVKRRVKNAIELNMHQHHQQEIIDMQMEEIRNSNDRMISAMATILENHSMETGNHNSRMSLMTKVVLKNIAADDPSLGLDKKTIQTISRAAVLHDVGKVTIPEEVLNKPGRLTKEEFEVMKTHSAAGAKIIEALRKNNIMGDQDFLQYAYLICRHHHERYDGKGYPDSLEGEDIPLCAQAVALADVYDALTSVRCYKAAFSPEKAAEMILGGECGKFSDRMLRAFQKSTGEFQKIIQDFIDNQ